MEKNNFETISKKISPKKDSTKSQTLDKFLNITKSGKRKATEEEEDIISAKQSKKEITRLSETKTTEEIDIRQPSSNIESNPKSSLDSLDSFISGLGTWKEPLSKFIKTDRMNSIYKFCKGEYAKNTVYPPQDLIFNAFNTTTWQNLKVVIIGQDPYPNIGQAMGLSFSVNRGIAVPKSLVNIYKCLENDKKLNFKPPKHGDLSGWASQGVFLLNATLTVIDKKANSHQKTSGWSDFTDFVIKTISDQKKGVVFLLWGNFAIAKKKLINCSKHLVIESIHPSPLAATKGDFTKSTQFSEVNEYLAKNEREIIDWNLSP